MSYEYRIGEKREERINDCVRYVRDAQELLVMYNNSKFLKTNMNIREHDDAPWVFLSHSRKDFLKVRQLRNILEDEGLYPLMLFLKCIDDDDELDKLIKREIESRTRFILCESKNARTSRWVQKEVKVIKALNRDYEIINIDDEMDTELNEAKAKVKQLVRRSTIILSFDEAHEHIAYQIYLRLIKYDFRLFLHPLYDLSSKKDFNCVSGQYSDLSQAGHVVVIVGDWVTDPENEHANDLISSLHQNFIMPMIFETESLEHIVDDERLREAFSHRCYIYCNMALQGRVNAAVDDILASMLTPSSMIVYIRSFRDNRYGKPDFFEAGRLTTIMRKYSNINTAGDAAAIAECKEKGWGGAIDLNAAVYMYSRAEQIMGYPLYQEEIKHLQNAITQSLPEVSVTFWQKFADVFRNDKNLRIVVLCTICILIALACLLFLM